MSTQKHLEEFLNSNGWKFHHNFGENVFAFGISGRNGTFQCIADIDEKDSSFIFLSICGLNAPSKKRTLMAELLTRLNYGNILGNFEMDFEDGEIRFRTSTYFKSIDLNIEIIERLIMVNVVSMDTCLPSIMNLISNDTMPTEAMKLVKD